jgi:hypothetical protein
MIFGKRISEYVSFTKLFLGLILIVGIARLALSLGGVETSIARWLSISVVTLIAFLYYPVKCHTTGFGSYKHLLPISLVLAVTGQAIIAAGVVIAIQTGKDNIFSVPEYSGGQDGKNWVHVIAHVVVGLVIGPLFGWLLGSLVLFITRKVSPGSKNPAAAANA